MSDSPSGYGTGDSAVDRVNAMIQFTPQAKALGVTVTQTAKGRAWGKVPYRAELVGDPDTGVIAGGVLTTFLDQLCGAAAILAMDQPTIVATIDLRIDYMRPAQPGRDVLAEAQCYKIGKNIAFVRATAYEDTPDNPIAHAASAFAINSNKKKIKP
jgi:uncharacterized protein (TIGR00369 family)